MTNHVHPCPSRCDNGYFTRIFKGIIRREKCPTCHGRGHIIVRHQDGK